MRTFENARDVANHQGLVVLLVHSQVRHQRGERIVRYLGLCVAERSEEGGLARIWDPHNADISHELELQLNPHLKAFLPVLGYGGGLAVAALEGRVAATACTALEQHVPLTLLQHFAEHHSALGVANHSAFWYIHHHVLPRPSLLLAAPAMQAASGPVVNFSPEVLERAEAVVGAGDNHVAAIPTVAAAGAPVRHVLLTAECNHTVSSIASFQA
mmetsp:Transcript_3407/g.6733  ORF Transcript_3407/g.6733 Transcript_3407/m.6733 type:complete len:214 (+) Transcript_3407:914-1555(+)